MREVRSVPGRNQSGELASREPRPSRTGVRISTDVRFILTFAASPRSNSPRYVNPESDRNTTRNTDTRSSSLETLPLEEGSIGIQALPPPWFAGTRVGTGLNRYTWGPPRLFTGTYTQRRVLPANRGKFRAHCVSESVLGIPGHSSGCTLTARNPAEFLTFPRRGGVCRETATTMNGVTSKNFNGIVMEIRVYACNLRDSQLIRSSSRTLIGAKKDSSEVFLINSCSFNNLRKASLDN